MVRAARFQDVHVLLETESKKSDEFKNEERRNNHSFDEYDISLDAI